MNSYFDSRDDKREFSKKLNVFLLLDKNNWNMKNTIFKIETYKLYELWKRVENMKI